MGKTEELRAESVNVIIEKRCRETTSAKYSFFMNNDLIEI